MPRIVPVLLLGSATLALLHAQPTLTSLQSDSSSTATPRFGPAITSGTNLPNGMFLYINGTFTVGLTPLVTWNNTVTGVNQTFSGQVNNAGTQVVVDIPAQGSSGSMFGTPVATAQTVNITVTEQVSVSAGPPSNALPFTLNPPLAAPSQTVFPAGTTGISYSTTIFTGGTAPYTVTPSSGALPPGLSPNNSPVLSGTPTQTGLFQFALQITDEWSNQLTTPTETVEIVAPPTISQIGPNSAPAGSNATVFSVIGTGFVGPTNGLNPNYAGTTVAIVPSGSSSVPIDLSTTVVNSTSATATIPAQYLSTPQTLNIVVVQPSGATSSSLPFSVLPPTISGITPSQITARTTPVPFTVSGANFLGSGFGSPTQTTVVINDSSLATTFNSSTSVSSSAVFSSPGTVQVQVVNPGGSFSNLSNINVLPDPAISSVTPSPFQGGALTVNGGNFTSTMTVLFNGAPVSTSFVSAAQLIANVPQNLVTGASALVSVQTADNYTTPATTIPLGAPIQIATASLPSGTTGQPYDAKLSANGGRPPYSWTAGGLPRGLSISSSTGEITGTPTVAGNFTVSITATDSNSAFATVQLPLTIAVPAPPPQIVSSPLPNGFVNVAYNYFFTATGGNGTLTFSVGNGSLPPVFGLSPDGHLQGEPSTTGTYTFTITVTDAYGYNSSADFTLTIKPQPLAVVTGALIPVTVGTAVSVKFTALGGVPPYTFSASGSLPPGVSVASDGTLSGTPTSPGAYTFTITVNDSVSTQPPGTKTFTLTVNPATLALAVTFPDGQVGVAYSAQLGATGGVPPYSFTVTGLPDGLSFTNGAVTGTPTAAGQFTASVTVTDSQKTAATQRFTFKIAPPGLIVTTASLPNGAVGVSYSVTLAASGGSGQYSWSVTGLPAGVSATPAGAISGTPTAAGPFTVNVTVNDGATTASKSYSISVVAAALSVTTASLANGTVGTAYSAALAAAGGVSPYTWSASGLPAGLAIASSGAISGTPTAAATSSVAVTVKDSAGATASHTYQVTIALPTPPALNLTGLPPNSTPATQSTLQIGLSAPYPVPVTVNLTLTFAADSGPDDPTVQFSTGGRTAQLTIPANTTAAPNTLGVQTGTVAGAATITAQLLAGTQDITPSPAPTRTVRINSVAPVATAVAAASTSTGFTVTVTGYATARRITQAIFTFTPAAGVNLQSTSVTISVDTLFSAWYSSSAATPFGSQFIYTQPFTVTGGTAAVSSVSVTLVNADGSSTPVTVTVH